MEIMPDGQNEKSWQGAGRWQTERCTSGRIWTVHGNWDGAIMQSTLTELSSSLPAYSTNPSTFSSSHPTSILVLRMVGRVFSCFFSVRWHHIQEFHLPQGIWRRRGSFSDAVWVPCAQTSDCGYYLADPGWNEAVGIIGASLWRDTDDCVHLAEGRLRLRVRPPP